MDTPSEYMVLLSSFDGYIIQKENLPDIISLLKQHEDAILDFSRLQMFEDALNELYDCFFITATSLADYEKFMTYHFDEEGLEEVSPTTLTDEVWDIWEAYQEQ